MPPLPPSREHVILKAAAERLKLHPFDIPMLRNTVPYNGRGGCMRCRWCVGFACEVDAKCGTHNTVIPRALATGNCTLRTECVVRKIVTDDQGRVTGVEYFDERGHRAGAARRPRGGLRLGHRNRRACCSIPRAAFSPTASATAMTGWDAT